MNFLFKISEEFTEQIAGIYSSLMPIERRNRFIQCKNILHRKQIVAAYMLLCYGLGNVFGYHNIRLIFDYSQTGKPYLHNNIDKFFSISHSGEYVLCSVAKCDIGSDIQKTTSNIDSVSDFSIAESLLKLNGETENKNSDLHIKTYCNQNSDYVIAISSFNDVDRDINYVHLKDLINYFSKFTSIGEYAHLNRYENAFNVNYTPLKMFEQCVSSYGNRTAVSFKGTSITYSELDKYSNVIARRLIDAGVKTGDIILLSVQPGIEFSIAEFGIMKAGGTYVPVYKRWPIERVNYIIKDCNIKVALFGQENLFYDCQAEIKLSCCDYSNGDSKSVETKEEENEVHNIIYTSGSTGNPKGVMIKKKNLASFSSDSKGTYYREIVHSKYVRVACICPISFDMSVAENTTTLLNGGTVVFADEEDQYPENFADFILKNQIDVIWATPSKFKMYLQSEVCQLALQNLKIVVLAGEILDFETARLSAKFSFRLYNTYGPTETTIISTYYPVTKIEPNLPIGRPFANEYCYVINSEGRLCEIGEKGELLIAGDCVAAGYNNNQSQTSERFLINPFGHGQIYSTGDVVSIEHDGLLHFFGRKDNQVKINGFRVELEEIESVIYQLTGYRTVAQCYEGKIVAFIECSAGQYNLSEKLKKLLPDYMIPAQIYYIEKFPLNNNDKIDKKALLKLLTNNVAAEYVAPQTATQKLIATCWSKFLGGARVGIDDEFYSLGGDSICAMRIASDLRQNGLNISMFDILNHKTVRNLSADIESRTEGRVKLFKTYIDPNICAPADEHVPLDVYYEYQKNFDWHSPICKYVPLKMHRTIMQSTSACDRSIFKVTGTSDKGLIIKSIRKLIKNNPAFRTIYDRSKNQCIQFNYIDCWDIPTIKLEKTNKRFLDAAKEVSLIDEKQYLSYIFLAEDKEGSIYIVILLQWRFCDRAAMQIVKKQLIDALNNKKSYSIGITDPLEYTELIRCSSKEKHEVIPEEVAEMLSRFAELAINNDFNKFLHGLDCIHFNCSVALDRRLNNKFNNSPLNFIIELFSSILHNSYKLANIPIYVVDQNRNIVNKNLVDTVIDFLPLVIFDKKYDYYRRIKAIQKIKHGNSILIESGEWNTSDELLPFVNYISVLDENDCADIEVVNRAWYSVQEEIKHDNRISCSAFIKDGKLVLSISLPATCKHTLLEALEEFIRQ